MKELKLLNELIGKKVGNKEDNFANETSSNYFIEKSSESYCIEIYSCVRKDFRRKVSPKDFKFQEIGDIFEAFVQ